MCLQKFYSKKDAFLIHGDCNALGRQTGAAEGKLPKGGQSGKSFSVEKRRKLERQVGGERVLEGAETAAGCGDHAPSLGASHLLLVFQSPWPCQVGEKGQAVSSPLGW